MSVLEGINSKALKTGDSQPTSPALNTFRIYSMRFCPAAQRVLIYASVKKIQSEVININLQQKPDWYFTKIYKGQVPTLEHAEGKKLVIESAVIPEYLDDIFPETRILPSDPYEKVQQKLMLERLSDQLTPAFGRVFRAIKNPEELKEKFEGILKAFKEAENLLEGAFYSGTSSPGFVDYLIYPSFQRVYWLAFLLESFPLPSNNFPGPDYPKLSQWFKTIAAIPEVAAASQSTENGVGSCKEYMKGLSYFDYGL